MSRCFTPLKHTLKPHQEFPSLEMGFLPVQCFCFLWPGVCDVSSRGRPVLYRPVLNLHAFAVTVPTVSHRPYSLVWVSQACASKDWTDRGRKALHGARGAAVLVIYRVRDKAMGNVGVFLNFRRHFCWLFICLFTQPLFHVGFRRAIMSFLPMGCRGGG